MSHASGARDAHHTLVAGLARERERWWPPPFGGGMSLLLLQSEQRLVGGEIERNQGTAVVKVDPILLAA